ncbi:thioredoxin family protein [Rhodomicrobium vannielii ATCC 17100]|uniref:thioredoxin domain-containing protein n=1 Tax=Rhodomicrobium vannielii TaxID=1069 RepID=UPI00191B7C1F|nr:thioredoxin family protein [Rhodomicrobium vannielii ATCC 17100]
MRWAALLLVAVAIPAAGFWMFQAVQPAIEKASARFDGDAVQAVLRQGKPTVAEFGSDKCVGCREMKKILDGLSREHGASITVVSVDVLANRDYIRRYQIQAMPTQIFFDAEGREVSRHMGPMSREDILFKLGLNALPPETAARRS